MTGKILNLKRKTAILTAASMMLTISVPAVNAAEPTDISGHWAQSTIESWIGNGVMQGYGDGSFRPDAEITRAEFVTFVNRAFGYTKEGTAAFTDVNDADWFAKAFRIATEAGYISGYPDGTAQPNSPITREEVAKIIAFINHLEPNESAANTLKDADGLTWSKGYVGAVIAAKIMTGYPDGTFGANNLIKRSETAVTAERSEQYLEIHPVTEVPAPVVVVPRTGGGSSSSSVTLTSYTAAIGAVSEANYTPASWASYVIVRDANVVTSANTQNQIDTATAAITTAQAQLISLSEVAALGAAKNEAGLLTEADYTVATWSDLTTALALPEVTHSNIVDKTTEITNSVAGLVFAGLSNLNAAKAAEALLTSTDYDDYTAVTVALALAETTNALIVIKTTAIEDAITALEFAGQAALDTAIASTAILLEADYTVGTWNDLETALALPETTNAEVVAKTTAIDDAVAGLVLNVQAEANKITAIALGALITSDDVLAKAQALVSVGYTVTVLAADGTIISAAGVASADGAGTISFTVTEDAKPSNTVNTPVLDVTVTL